VTRGELVTDVTDPIKILLRTLTANS